MNRFLIPTGEIAPVANTPFDFTAPRAIGERIAQVEGGYDHCMVLRQEGDDLRRCAVLEETESGRCLEALTTLPALQFYSGNFLNGSDRGKGGMCYAQHAGMCLEPQHYPDAMNHREFPDCLLEPGESYRHTTVYRFGTC